MNEDGSSATGGSPLPKSLESSVRTPVANNVIEGLMLRAELSMRFNGSTADEFQDWKGVFKAQLNDLLGPSTPPAEWSTTVEWRTEHDDHIRYQLLLVSKGVPSLPVYLLVPRDLDPAQPVPGVVCVHGHGPFGNDPIVGRCDSPEVQANLEAHNYDYGLEFVRRGYVVAAPCLLPFGRRVEAAAYAGNDPCSVTFLRMQAIGQLPMTANLRDLRWSIDLLQSLTEVASDRIGCAGLSYGGRMTMMVAAIDPRVQVAAVSGALSLLQERLMMRNSCGSQVIPGLLNFGDYSEIGSLIAPKPCVWETGSTDPMIVDPEWADLFRNRLKSAYAASNAQSELHFDEFEGGHEWRGRIAFLLFDQVLKSDLDR